VRYLLLSKLRQLFLLAQSVLSHFLHLFSETVSELKANIESKTGIPVIEQVLLHEGQEWSGDHLVDGMVFIT
jgi:hypothetical protein